METRYHRTVDVALDIAPVGLTALLDIVRDVLPEARLEWTLFAADRTITGNDPAEFRGVVTANTPIRHAELRAVDGEGTARRTVHYLVTTVTAAGPDEIWVAGVGTRLEAWVASLEIPMVDSSPQAAGSQEQFAREFDVSVDLPSHLRITDEAIVGVAREIGSCVEGPVSWEMTLAHKEKRSGSGAETLAACLSTLPSRPTDMSLRASRHESFKTTRYVRLGFGYFNRVHISGKDENWVAGTERVLRRDVYRLLGVTPWWRRPRTYLAAILGFANLALQLYAVRTSAQVTFGALLLGILSPIALALMVMWWPFGRAPKFVGADSRHPWIDSAAGRLAVAISTVIATIAALVQLAVLLLDRRLLP